QEGSEGPGCRQEGPGQVVIDGDEGRPDSRVGGRDTEATRSPHESGADHRGGRVRHRPPDLQANGRGWHGHDRGRTAEGAASADLEPGSVKAVRRRGEGSGIELNLDAEGPAQSSALPAYGETARPNPSTRLIQTWDIGEVPEGVADKSHVLARPGV